MHKISILLLKFVFFFDFSVITCFCADMYTTSEKIMLKLNTHAEDLNWCCYKIFPLDKLSSESVMHCASGSNKFHNNSMIAVNVIQYNI